MSLIIAIINIPDVAGAVLKLDGVGPVDNRPSTGKLHHFLKKKKIIIIVTRDT